ncbi:MAG: alpha/beta hydrolase [Asgard group archaeon]|nr:alpha/beta hydrolase [Asgard group archaeon]
MGKKSKDRRTELEKKAKELFFEMDDGTKVRVLDFNLTNKPNKYTLFFIPGFITVFQSWHKAIEILSKDFRIYYFESREKFSSVIPDRKVKRRITFEKMAHDIKEVIEQMNLDGTHYITVCSSTGGTIEAIALSNDWLNPKGAVMVGPTIIYHVSILATSFIRIVPAFLKQLVMPIVKWYITKVYVDKNAEPEQLVKYVRAVEEADLIKIRRPVTKMRKKNIQHLLPKVKARTYMIGASTDKMHAAEETLENSKLMPNAKYIDLLSNKAAHEQPLVDVIFEFIQELENA